MTHISKSSTMLQDLQDKMGKILEERKEAARNYTPSSTFINQSKADIKKEPTAEDILLMEEYNRGVYQGD